jgi:hypothetical protein
MKVLEESLREAGQRLVHVIRKDDSRELLNLFYTKGVAIGIDKWATYDAIKQDFRTKGRVYCEFFDTVCFQQHLKRMRSGPPEDLQGPLPAPLSYRELLDKVSGVEISVKVERSPSGEIWGQVMLGWDSPRPQDLGFLSFLNFTFILEKGAWKLGGDSSDSY